GKMGGGQIYPQSRFCKDDGDPSAVTARGRDDSCRNPWHQRSRSGGDKQSLILYSEMRHRDFGEERELTPMICKSNQINRDRFRIGENEGQSSGLEGCIGARAQVPVNGVARHEWIEADQVGRGAFMSSKTNMLAALHFLCHGSHRRSRAEVYKHWVLGHRLAS